MHLLVQCKKSASAHLIAAYTFPKVKGDANVPKLREFPATLQRKQLSQDESSPSACNAHSDAEAKPEKASNGLSWDQRLRSCPSGSIPPAAVALRIGALCGAAPQPGLPESFLMLDTLRSPVVSLASDMAICKTVAWLNEQLELGNERLLLMDCRPQELYESSHIESAINVALPGIMLRRLQKGNLPLRALFARGEEEREKFARRCGTDTVVLYDENSSDWNENTVGDSVLGLLLKRLKDDGCKAFYLEGEGLTRGFCRFQAEYALHCETNLDSSCSSNSPPLPVLGLGGLRISSDSSSDVESDIDRDPNSATDSDGSPLSNNQPSFPVEILPYLYLGCAKDSTNLDVLEEFGIKYILNVTPNLPNLFENAGEFKYKQIPISDHWSQNLSQFFPEAISFIDEARGKNCGVLVHCLAGISRSVTVTVAYLMQKLNLSMNDAYDIVKMKKSNISPNFNFMGQLLDFERTLGLNSPCDNRMPTQQLYFTTPSNQNVFQVDSLQST